MGKYESRRHRTRVLLVVGRRRVPPDWDLEREVFVYGAIVDAKNQAGSSAESRVSCRWFEFPWADHPCRQRHYFIFYYHDHSIFRASWLTPTNVSRCLFEILSHVLQLSCSCPQSCLEAANFIKKVRISPRKTFHPGKRFDISQHKCCLCGLPKSAQFESIP